MKKFTSIALKSIGSIFVFYIFLGFFLIPYFIQYNTQKLLKEQLNIESYVDSVFLNPFNFHVRIDNFMIKDKQNQKLVFFEKLTLNFDPLKILENKIVLKNIKLENFNADINIDKNKVANFQYILDNLNKNSSNDTQKTSQNPPFEIIITSFNLKDAVINFKDYSKEKEFEVYTKPINFTLNNFEIKKDHINNINLIVQTKQTGEFELNSSLIFEPFSAKGDIKLSSVNLNKIFNYVKPSHMDFDFDSKGLDIDLRYHAFSENFSLEDIKITSKEFGVLDIQKNARFDFLNLKTDIDRFSNDKTKPVKIIQTLNTPKNGELKANIDLVQEPLDITAEFQAKDIDLGMLKPYVKDFANIDIISLVLSNKADIKIKKQNENTHINLKSDITLKDIDLQNTKQNQKLFKAKKIDIKDLNYKEDNLFISNIDIVKPFIPFYKNKNGSNNFSNITKKSDTKKEEKASSFSYTIKELNIKDGSASFEDKTIKPAFKTLNENIQAKIENITSDKTKQTTIEHKSIIDKYATFDIKSSLFVLEPLEKTDTVLYIKNINLPSLSSYSGKFIGNKISNGKFDLSVDVKIDNGVLKNKNKLKIKDITLGEKVQSEDAIKAPVALAIALLKDSRGIINLDIPIDGNIKDPKFHLGDAITDVITNLLVGLVSSPFKFLGMLAGIDGGDDMAKVQFSFGSYEIEVTQKEKLDNILKAFTQRPNLSLALNTAIIKDKDIQALRSLKFKTTYPLFFDENLSQKEKLKTAKEVFQKEFENEKPDELLEDILKKLEQKIVIEENELNDLALNRAKAIKEYLVKNNLEESRVIINEKIKESVFNKSVNGVEVEFEVKTK